MDTLLTDAPLVTLASAVSRPTARLPGEDDQPEPVRAPTADLPDRRLRPQLRRSRRKVQLMSGVAVILVAVAAGVAFHERERIEHLPMMQRLASVTVVHRLLMTLSGGADRPTSAAERIASTDVALPPPVRPQTAAAAPPVPPATKPTGTVGRTALPPEPTTEPLSPPAPLAAAAPHVPSPQQAELNELAALQPDAPKPLAPTPHPPADSVGNLVPPSAAGVPPPPAASPAHEGTLSVGAAAPAKAPAPIIHAPPASAIDPVEQAAALQAAPMAPPQQIDLLHLMTEMAIVVRDLRTENGELRSQVANLATEVDTKTTQFERRLSLAEAKGAIAAAMGDRQAMQATITVTAAPTGSLDAKLPAKSAPPAPPPLVRSVKDYRIQAASPGLAVLSTVGLTSDGTSSIQVAIGDEVPGVGRIKAIYQRGASWVVQTNNGLIQ